MARIAIYIGRHLCTAPRPVKEADALAAAGHDVSVHGLWFDSRLVARDKLLLQQRAWRFEPYADCRPEILIGRVRWFDLRLRHRFARSLYRRRGIVLPDVLGYGTGALLAHARTNGADLSIFHSEGGLRGAVNLHRAGRRVGFDFEDWFSRDMPDEQRAARPIAALQKMEASVLQFGPYVLTTSHVMADALAHAYGGPAPSVIYNTFPQVSLPAPRTHESSPVSLHWFSQTLGPGRGLEPLFDALPQLDFPWVLHLTADDPARYRDALVARLPGDIRKRVHVTPTVPNADLPASIAQHDIGLALDVSTIPSRNLTITNKLFQYMQSGLAVVASDTAGHLEALRLAHGAGEVFESGNPQAIAAAIGRLGASASRLAAAKAAARDAALSTFSHERQVPTYAALAARALSDA